MRRAKGAVKYECRQAERGRIGEVGKPMPFHSSNSYLNSLPYGSWTVGGCGSSPRLRRHVDLLLRAHSVFFSNTGNLLLRPRDT